ncbi:YbhN family protein [Streptomyces sp. NPDC048251]|uniref:lysylphosphatidylglycerol synthase transmembrane domain-containing protein n=1 Tax=Streptomyces sp. NPDC048251 TaxID=3154501 RepID=UPI003434A9CF
MPLESSDTAPVSGPAPASPPPAGQVAGPEAVKRRRRRWLRRVAIAALVGLFATELVLAWPSLASALGNLRSPHLGWLAAATVAELAAMGAYARMQRHLLRSGGVHVAFLEHVALAYAAHSLSVTLPGGPAFSTRFNYQQMRRFGASPAVASWCITLSGILSATALAVVTAAGALANGEDAQWHDLIGLAVAAALVVLGVRRVMRRSDTVVSIGRVVLAHINRLRRRPAEYGRERVRSFLDQLHAARLHPAHGFAAASFAILNWLFDAVCLWMCCLAVADGHIGPAQVLLAFCAAMAAGSITIIPGGLGIIDSALILGLLSGGISTATAVAAVVLYRIISFGFIIGAGWISWLIIRHRFRDHVVTG